MKNCNIKEKPINIEIEYIDTPRGASLHQECSVGLTFHIRLESSELSKYMKKTLTVEDLLKIIQSRI